MSKTTILIDSELNKQIAIISILEGKKKEELAQQIIKEGIKPYQDKLDKMKFS